MELNKSQIDRVEENIAPPMRAAVTIPVEGTKGVVVYVAVSAFAELPVQEMRSAVMDVAQRLRLGPSVGLGVA